MSKSKMHDSRFYIQWPHSLVCQVKSEGWRGWWQGSEWRRWVSWSKSSWGRCRRMRREATSGWLSWEAISQPMAFFSSQHALSGRKNIMSIHATMTYIIWIQSIFFHSIFSPLLHLSRLTSYFSWNIFKCWWNGEIISSKMQTQIRENFIRTAVCFCIHRTVQLSECIISALVQECETALTSQY